MVIKAVILAGGRGTRLRPFTLTKPKPIIEFVNKPMIIHQIEALKLIGCNEVILAVSYKDTIMEEFLKEWQHKLDIKITISQEKEALDTAGPLNLIRNILSSTDIFFVLNSDVVCTYPLDEMLIFHKNIGAEGTLLLTNVDDPTRYGVVLQDIEKRIHTFVEKPKTFVGNMVNAGIYLFNSSILNRITKEKMSFEKDIFPSMANDSVLFGYHNTSFWADIGKPNDFLIGTQLYLQSKGIKELCDSSSDYLCCIENNVVIGKNCFIAENVIISNSTIMDNVRIESGCVIRDSIIGWNSTIECYSHILGSFIGEDVTVKSEVILNETTVLPHKTVTDSCYSKKIIL